MRIIGVAMLIVAAGLAAGIAPADAQSNGMRAPDDQAAARPFRRARPRITVVPRERERRYVRQCVDWYQVERRPSGTVITPQMRCVWAVQ